MALSTVAGAQQIRLWPIEKLVPYARNARTHSPEQIEKIAASIREYGFTNPILVDGAAGIIAGHGRLAAAKVVGLAKVPVIELAHLSDAQRRALVIADNRLALDAGWDEAILADELAALQQDGFDLDLTGFAEEEVERLLREAAGEGGAGGGEDPGYSSKVTPPTYTPKGERPAIGELTDDAKAKELIDRIAAAKIGAEEKAFLIRAAGRHIVFDYHAIAEFYCHASPEVQALMEDSALVIIDFDGAIERGYVEMSEKLEAIYTESHGDDDGDAQ